MSLLHAEAHRGYIREIPAVVGTQSDENSKAMQSSRPGDHISLTPLILACGQHAMTTVALVVALAMPLQAGEAQKSGWKAFQSQEGGFSVLMPGTPVEQEQSVDSRIGPIRSRMFFVDRGVSGFIVGYDDYPEAVLKQDPKRLIDGKRDAIVAGMGGKLLDQRALKQDEYPGQEIAAEMPDGSVYKARMFLVRRRLYLAAAVVPEAQADSEDVKTFLDSFKVTTDEPAPAPRGKVAAWPGRPTQVDWQRVAPLEGGFSVLMPGTPAERKQAADSPMGSIQINTFTLVKDRDEFTVAFTDYPAAILKSKPETILEGVRIGVEADLQAKLLDERPTSLDGYPGRQYRLEVPASRFPGGGIYRVRAYLVKQRLYQVVAVTPKATVSSMDSEKFFQSFRLSAKR
jgi:hypothetical protein